MNADEFARRRSLVDSAARTAVTPRPDLLGPFTVAISDLSGDLSPRSRKLDPEHVRVLGEVLDHLPPPIVDQRRMCVIDGVHRVEAFRRAGRTHVKVMLFTGGEIESYVLAVEANVKHGSPLSMAERRAAAAGLLQRCPERSDRWIGATCGLSHSTVAVLRRDIEVAVVSRRVGRDGRRRPIDVSVGRVAVETAISQSPSASFRELAGIAGVSASTARSISRRQVRPAPTKSGRSKGSRRNDKSHDAVLLNLDEAAFKSRPELRDSAEWLERTSVDTGDLSTYLEALPLSRLYEVADECRRRAEVWAELARGLERRVNRRAV